MDREGANGRTRFGALVSLVPPGSRVVDVGSGHGKLPRRLLAAGRAVHCIATERTETLLAEVIGFGPGHPLAARLERRSGDGLDAVTRADRLDVVTVSGLGGRSQVRILERGLGRGLRFGRYVVQPQGDVACVRQWLASRGLGVVDERLLLERGRYYVAIAAEPGRSSGGDSGLSEEDLLEAGPCLTRSGDPLVRRFWTEQLAHLDRISRRARGPGRLEATRKRRLAKRVLAALPPARSSGIQPFLL